MYAQLRANASSSGVRAMVLQLPARSWNGTAPALGTRAITRSCASTMMPLCGSCMRHGPSVMGKCLVQGLLICYLTGLNTVYYKGEQHEQSQ